MKKKNQYSKRSNWLIHRDLIIHWFHHPSPWRPFSPSAASSLGAITSITVSSPCHSSLPIRARSHQTSIWLNPALLFSLTCACPQKHTQPGWLVSSSRHQAQDPLHFPSRFSPIPLNVYSTSFILSASISPPPSLQLWILLEESLLRKQRQTRTSLYPHPPAFISTGALGHPLCPPIWELQSCYLALHRSHLYCYSISTPFTTPSQTSPPKPLLYHQVSPLV